MEKNKKKYWDGKTWRVLTKKDKSKIVSSMPLNPYGLPAPWPKEGD